MSRTDDAVEHFFSSVMKSTMDILSPMVRSLTPTVHTFLPPVVIVGDVGCPFRVNCRPSCSRISIPKMISWPISSIARKVQVVCFPSTVHVPMTLLSIQVPVLRLGWQPLATVVSANRWRCTSQRCGRGQTS